MSDAPKLGIMTLARTIYGEARGEPLVGRIAVGCVVRNRVAFAQERGGYWWGSTVEEVCRKPYQFSCWLERDPNYEKLLKVTAFRDSMFADCVETAVGVLDECWSDPTDGCTHYHNATVKPQWAQDRKPHVIIGNHMFYKGIG